MAIARNTGRKRRPKVVRTTNTQGQFYGIVKELSGRVWPVEYLNKIAGTEETISSFDIKQEEYLKNFNRIGHMPLHVTSELPEIGVISDLKGEAILNVGILPTKGDAFIGTLSNASLALFDVYDVDRLSYNGQPVYKISYGVKEFISTQEKLEGLRESVDDGIVEELVFDPGHIHNNTKPLLREDEYLSLESLMRLQVEMKSFWINHIMTESMVLTPILNSKVLVDTDNKYFIEKMVGSLEGHSHALETIGTMNKKVITIYDIIRGRGSIGSMMSYNEIRHESTTPANAVSQVMLMDSDYCSVKNNVPGPIFVDGVADLAITDHRRFVTRVDLVTPSATNSVPSLFNDTYIFSELFYVELGSIASDATKTYEPLTLLEKVVLGFIKNDLDGINDVITLLTEIYKFNYNEHIYFSPIILYIASQVNGVGINAS